MGVQQVDTVQNMRSIADHPRLAVADSTVAVGIECSISQVATRLQGTVPAAATASAAAAILFL